MILRPATAADLQRIAEIRNASLSGTWTREDFERYLGEGRGLLLVCCSEADEVLGFVLASSVLDEAEILSIAVSQDLRGRGCGRLLIEAVQEQLRDQGVGRLFLEVADDAANVAQFYRKFGFREVGRRAGYYREGLERPVDAIVMESSADAVE